MQGTLNWNSKWLPQFAWVVENERIHTRLNVVPHVFTDDPAREFEVTVSMHEGSVTPVAQVVSPRLRLGGTWRVEFRDELRAVQRQTFDGLLLIRAYEVGQEPRVASVLQTYLDWYSDDGRIDFRVNASQANGHRVGHYATGAYEIFPGIPGDPQYRAALIVLNFQWAPIAFRLDLFNAAGKERASAEMSARPFSSTKVDFGEAFADYHDFLGRAEQGAVRLWSKYRVVSFVLLENARTGSILAVDHLSRYFGRPRVIPSPRQMYVDGLRASMAQWARRLRELPR